MSMGRQQPRQGELFVAAEDLRSPGHPFYERLNEVLAKHEFDRQVEALCAPHYADGWGRESTPPGVLFRMYFIGYFEGVNAERALAWRCRDSLSLKAFLGFGPAEKTPDHSWLSIARRRLPEEVFRKVFKLVLAMLKAESLLKGRHLALDSTTLKANAAMASIVRKDTNKSYADYVGELAAEAGEPAPTRGKQARFDKERPGRTTSNAEWTSPADPDAKITKLKDGRTALAYKPETVVDLHSGAIVASAVQCADRGDTGTAASTLVEARENLEHVGLGLEDATLVADKGYHADALLTACVNVGMKTCVAEPKRRTPRRWTDKPKVVREANLRNRRRTRSEYGRTLHRRRSAMGERAHAHLKESGGLDRTHVRGLGNVGKRHAAHIAAFNLGVLMRKLTGFGAPRAFAALQKDALRVTFAIRRRHDRRQFTVATNFARRRAPRRRGQYLRPWRPTTPARQIPTSSTDS